MIVSKHAKVNLEVLPSSEGASIVLGHLGPDDSWDHRFVIDRENLLKLKVMVDEAIQRHERIWGRIPRKTPYCRICGASPMVVAIIGGGLVYRCGVCNWLGDADSWFDGEWGP